ncbi:MAG: alpha/beta fold hydrolase [Rubrivivax sp.]|nr:alpha/beta fold hydrolase [Rubrivivax sp.]
MKSFIRKTIGLLLIATALTVAWIRAPDRPVDTLIARWAVPPSEFVEVKGQIVHLRDEGPREDAVPILLVHGTSASLHTWEGWVKALKPQRRVISFDQPGFGLTGPFSGQYPPDDYRGDSLARFVIDLMDHLKLNTVVIGGNSLGGEVAWRTALLAPQRVERLILVDASGTAFKPQEIPPGFLAARTPVINRVGEHLLPRPLVSATLHSVYADDSRVSEQLVDRYYELTLREGNRRALGQRLAALEADLNPELINQIKQPTLILWGERDRLIPPVNAQEFGRRIAGSQVVILPGLGHVPHEEDPAASVAPVKSFLGLR